MAQITADICIIGAGSGGLSLAAGAAQMGARVVLIEGGEMGGDCLNSGCVPSKALLAAAKAAHAVQAGARLGITAAPPQIDFAAAMAHVAATIAEIAPMDSQERFEGFGVQVVRAWASFTAPDCVQAGDDTIRARRFVIATGSRPFIPPIEGIDTVPYLTNETIFAQTTCPDHLIILGGGPIGLEMAQAHRRLGAQVTVIEGARALGRDDPDAAAVVLAALRSEGITILEGARVQRLGTNGAGVVAHLEDGTSVSGSHLLVAAGRAVAVTKLGLDAANIAHTPRGVTVDAALRSTSNRRVYAVGDAAGGAQFTHVAGAHAGVVIRQILFGLPARAATTVPWVTYTGPELAQIGLTEAAARAQYGAALSVHRADFSHNDRAVAEGKAKGFLKLMVVKSRPVGVTIVGTGAGEMIGLWSLALSQRLKLSAISGTILPYPTLSEASKRAAGAYFSPKLFNSAMVKRIVHFVQRYVP
jgi:pyruvate/2-oxoglutarate dehydrogenase complex dihydrolipoamide dehydrogenase (E3) component